MSRLAGLLTAALILGASTVAPAYVRTLTSHGNGIAWNESCVFLVPPVIPPAGVTQDAMLGAVQQSADTWGAVAGSYIQLVAQEPEDGLQAEYLPGGSNVNAIVFVDYNWPHREEAAALTTITYITSSRPSEDGRIIDTDVEVNTEDFQYATDGDPNKTDLANVLTHEFGHVLGLDHTCDDGTITPTPVDNLGTPIPPCRTREEIDNLPAAITEATMFNYSAAGETNKTTLEADDIAGVEAIYPLSDDPHNCAPPTLNTHRGCGCNTSRGGALGLLIPLALFFFVRRLRRRAVRYRTSL